jgi:hypothetical protein
MKTPFCLLQIPLTCSTSLMLVLLYLYMPTPLIMWLLLHYSYIQVMNFISMSLPYSNYDSFSMQCFILCETQVQIISRSNWKLRYRLEHDTEELSPQKLGHEQAFVDLSAYFVLLLYHSWMRHMTFDWDIFPKIQVVTSFIYQNLFSCRISTIYLFTYSRLTRTC